MKRIRVIIPLAILLFCYQTAWSEERLPDERALTAQDLIKQMEDLYRGNAAKATLTMQVETPNYQRTLTMESQSLGEENMLIRILSPKKDRGITTLKRENEMWNFFPKINKVIKVPPSMMMGSWMGSDFTNDDLVRETSLIDEYQLSYRETTESYFITLLPREQTVTVWGKIEYTISKENLLPVSETFYDEKGEKIRALQFSDVKEFSGRLLPSRLEMVPLNKDGHKTIVIYDDMEFDPPEVTAEIFSLRNLKKRF